MVIYENNVRFFKQIYSFTTLYYDGKTMTLWKKLWYYDKIMILYQKLCNFDLLWKKLWYYGKNYGTID